MKKTPIDIPTVFSRLRAAVAPFPPAALFQLADEGFSSPFEQLVACIISIRTLDEVTLRLARKFFAQARTPSETAVLSVETIDQIIYGSTFHGRKAVQIREIAGTIIREHGGELPCEETVMMAFPGVGIKCTNLVLGIACGQKKISVDVHVHRITNRWGYVQTRTPEATTEALTGQLPGEYWIEINRLLVPFGKHICTTNLPRCSICPLLEMCQQVGVIRHR